MVTKSAKKAQIRTLIMNAAHAYAKGNKIDNLYLPRTLRVKDRSVERSKDGDIVDFIFMREAVTDIYKTQTFADSNKKIPRVIENMIDSSFYQG